MPRVLKGKSPKTPRPKPEALPTGEASVRAPAPLDGGHKPDWLKNTERSHTDSEVWLQAVDMGTRIEAATMGDGVSVSSNIESAERVTGFADIVLAKYRANFCREA